MKRFYKDVAVVSALSGATIELDGRPVRTPKKAIFAVAAEALAEAIAEEWRRQDEDIVPESMPLFRLANTAIDLVAGQRGAVVDNLAGYGGTDLLCYRAGEPEDLVQRQGQLWSPWLSWAEAEHGARLVTTNGIGHIAQDEAALAALHRAVDGHDVMELAAMNDLVTIAGSLVLALAVSAGALDVAAAWAAVRLDNEYQAERWGRDAEAEAHAAKLRGEFEIAARFMDLHRAG
ncbi:MAG: ATPase [Rhodospirillaceae bacterium]|jgi:chaperone required for assembly of F1-ATPase|nr:ATPase [Rhodospirillaceae bacterium]MBT3494395.1 ATPase [Rhodospirillaceae bacterium]MBT3781300.1 ATPase [Rhodospirillaceae bacterium]MBT3978779.1 ATPase [Rhodospirillaceae bacterium]MBT4169726.1 ATPase [Rhodospirillaceae bacterium]